MSINSRKDVIKQFLTELIDRENGTTVEEEGTDNETLYVTVRTMTDEGAPTMAPVEYHGNDHDQARSYAIVELLDEHTEIDVTFHDKQYVFTQGSWYMEQYCDVIAMHRK